MLFRQLTIIGVGLIGGSLALAARKHGVCDHIVGCGPRLAQLQEALNLGVVDVIETDPVQAVSRADVVVIATPLSAMAEVFSRIKTALPPQTVVSDVGSIKAAVVASARTQLESRVAQFVPGHPIAGTEKSGVAHAFASLFEKRRVILTPLAENSPAAVSLIQQLWQAVGSQVNMMAVLHHDEVLAATSHVPHILAYTLVDALARMTDPKELFRFAAGGFRDFTRIVDSDPAMWSHISIENQAAILPLLQLYQQALGATCAAIQRNDQVWLMEHFGHAKQARIHLCE